MALGLSEVEVYAKPRVAIYSSGPEIAPQGQPLKPGQVYDINSYTVSAVVEANGGVPLRMGIMEDSWERVEACLKEGRLAVVYPTQEQTVHAEKEFSRPGVQVYADSVSPYTEGDVDGLVDRLRGFDPHLVFLNCFGFPLWLKERIKEEVGRPVLHSSSVVARIVKELL